MTLPPEIFGIEPNAAVLHQVVTAQLAAARSGTQSTRTRSEVRGGGAKPYKQKGTGRARQGSTRAPQWAGGGVALGPKPRSYHQRTPKKMIRLALCSALSDRAAEGRVAVVNAWGIDEPRTKQAVDALRALEIDGKALVVLDPDDIDAAYSFRNLPEVHIIAAAELNAYDVLRHDWVVFTDATLPGGPGPEAFAQADAAVPAKPALSEPEAEVPEPEAEEAPATPRPTRARRPAKKAAAPAEADAAEADAQEGEAVADAADEAEAGDADAQEGEEP
ncbi:MAG TPA: 50S ribosomal protein L4 [Acidimicrobiaceae bacterium]|nr:50S ribosomal protein L4 [Acidimicrobiaceae bacterium]